MPHYLVRVEGRDLHALVDDHPQCLGFYVNRVVRAASEEEAGLAALARVQAEAAQRSVAGSPPAQLTVDLVRRLSWLSVRWSKDSGFVFFPEEAVPPGG